MSKFCQEISFCSKLWGWCLVWEILNRSLHCNMTLHFIFFSLAEFSCSDDFECKAYQHTEIGPGNCILIYNNSTENDGHTFRSAGGFSIFKKGLSFYLLFSFVRILRELYMTSCRFCFRILASITFEANAFVLLNQI